MANQQASQQAVDARAPAPPEPNFSAEALQRLVDEAAHFNLFSLPGAPPSALLAPGGGNHPVGLKLSETLHRFEVSVQPPTSARPLRARNVVGEAVGQFTHRWLLIPDDFVALPEREPPPTVLDPARAQRFVMLDSLCRFGAGQDGFRGFGTGQTLPVTINGQRQLLVTAIGSVLEGFGRFKDHEAGTYVYCGSFSPQQGFQGNILLRVMDAPGTLRTAHSLPALEARPDPEPGITYLVLRGEAVPSDAVTPRIGPNGQLQGLNVEQGLRLLYLDGKARGRGGVQSLARVGPVVGRILARVNFDPTAPGGATLNPIPFTTFDEFSFFDAAGRNIGGFTGDSSEGRVFNILVGGQKGIRFGGTGRLLSGSGPFQGLDGLLTDNSVVIFTPHVSASVYVLRINDPDGRFRAAINEC